MEWDDPVGRLSDPTAEEFRNWVPWPRVHEFFGIHGPSPAVAEKLLRRLAAGSLFAAAESASWLSEGVRKTRGCTSVDASWWSSVNTTALTNAIEGGDVVIHVPDRSAGIVSTVNFENMRFEWLGIYDALPGLRARLHPMTAGAGQSPPAPLPPRSLANAPAAPAPRPEEGNGNDISQEEYDRWYEPGEVLDALPRTWTSHTKIETIADLLEDGLIRAVAGEMGGWDELVERFELPKIVWKSWAALSDHAFWAAGKREILKDHPGYSGPSFRAYRIRLDPADVHKRLPIAPGAIRAPVRQSRWIVGETFVTEPLTDIQSKVSAPTADAVDQWFAGLSEADQRLSVRNLHVLAKRTLPGALRKQFEKFAEGRPRGRRRSS